MFSETILDLGKCLIQKMHDSESAGFLVGALPEVQLKFKYIISLYILKLLFLFKFLKNAIVFLNLAEEGSRNFFMLNRYLFTKCIFFNYYTAVGGDKLKVLTLSIYQNRLMFDGFVDHPASTSPGFDMQLVHWHQTPKNTLKVKKPCLKMNQKVLLSAQVGNSLLVAYRLPPKFYKKCKVTVRLLYTFIWGGGSPDYKSGQKSQYQYKSTWGFLAEKARS